LSILLSLPLSAAARDDRRVQAAMSRELAAQAVSGAVWVTVSPGAAARLGAAGVKNAASGEPMQPATRVHVGSVAKTVLATGVLRLVTAGRLSLDSPVAALLPHLAFDNRWQASDPIRVRHLLAHTSGLDNVRMRHAFSLVPQADTPLADAFAGDPSLLRVHTRPGSRYAYSSMGYALLGMVIEAVEGVRYERYLDTQLLRPLSMHDSTFEFTTQSGPQADPRLAMGHFEGGATQVAVPSFVRPAGQFTTTAADMARLAAFLMGDGMLDGKRFIAPELMAALSRPSGTEAALAGLGRGHGLALAMRDRHGVEGACHVGTTIGFRAMLCLYPEQGKAFFVAINTDSETADYEPFNRILIDELDLARRHGPGPAIAAPNGLEQWQGIYVPTAFQMPVAAWFDTALSFTSLRWNGARLQLSPFQSSAISLKPAGDMLFQLEGRSAPSHVLLRSESGEQVLSDGLRSYKRKSWTTMIMLWSSTAAGLAGALYVLVAGLWQLARRRMDRRSILAAPLAALLALLLPLPFFLNQSFLQLGDRTTASVLLALVTGLLPVAMACGLVVAARRRPTGVRAACDAIASLAVLQWLLVLAAWGVLPLLLWR
jgi:CubicO group peptidase (beta-lactamase class C family)